MTALSRGSYTFIFLYVSQVPPIYTRTEMGNHKYQLLTWPPLPETRFLVNITNYISVTHKNHLQTSNSGEEKERRTWSRGRRKQRRSRNTLKFSSHARTNFGEYDAKLICVLVVFLLSSLFYFLICLTRVVTET